MRSRIEQFRSRLHDILDELGDDDSRLFELFISGLIFLNVLALILETVEAIHRPYYAWFYYFERFSIVIFTLEFLLRVWACTANPKYSHPILGRLRYIFTPMVLIDLLAILPFWLPRIFGWQDLRQLRAVRLLRLLKFFRYSKTLNLFVRVLWLKRQELVVTMSFMLILLLFAATAIFQIEHKAQPDKFTNLLDAMWWAIATLTTVGYGDIFPITPLGRFMASIIAILGIGMFALPTGILGAAFVEEIENMHKQEEASEPAKPWRYCPHCGEKLDESA